MLDWGLFVRFNKMSQKNEYIYKGITYIKQPYWCRVELVAYIAKVPYLTVQMCACL